jgi:hypothetical protein
LNELALDHCFWREVKTSSPFQHWLIGKTKFAGRVVRLVTDEGWHQRWYRDPETKKDSETDILLIFVDLENSQRYALHIENKTAHSKWEPDQAKNYRKRAMNRMKPLRYADFQTVLVAPASFIDKHPTEAAEFDLLLIYEEVGVFVPEFRIEMAKPPALDSI